MAVGSLASFNPSLPPASWLAEGMPLRSNPPPQILTTLLHLPISNVEEECEWLQRNSVATQWEPLPGAWGSRLQMKDKTQDDDNDDVAILGIARCQPSFLSSHSVWQAEAGLKCGDVDVGDPPDLPSDATIRSKFKEYPNLLGKLPWNSSSTFMLPRGCTTSPLNLLRTFTAEQDGFGDPANPPAQTWKLNFHKM